MATALDLGLLDYFSVIFPALLVWVIVFAVLEKTKLLGKNKLLHTIIATSIAFLVMISKDVITIINFGAPWFVLVFVFLTLLLLVYMLMGATEEDIHELIKKDMIIKWTIFAIGVIIVVASISNVYGQRLLEQADAEGITVKELQDRQQDITFRSELYNTIFNTKVLGLIFIFLVATFTIALLSKQSIPIIDKD